MINWNVLHSFFIYRNPLRIPGSIEDEEHLHTDHKQQMSASLEELVSEMHNRAKKTQGLCQSWKVKLTTHHFKDMQGEGSINHAVLYFNVARLVHSGAVGAIAVICAAEMHSISF